MTLQIKDSIIPNEKEDKSYSITRYSGKNPFDIEEYFERPFIYFTACWRGYVAEFLIRDKKLLLHHLRVFKETKTTPKINGVDATFKDFLGAGAIPEYDNIGLKLNYTGRILVETGYIHLGLGMMFQDVGVEHIKEYHFVSGSLQKEEDLSELTRKFREELFDHAREHYNSDEMMNKILSDSVRNKKNLARAQQTIVEAGEALGNRNLSALPNSISYELFRDFKLKDRELNREFNQRIYKNYGRSGFDW